MNHDWPRRPGRRVSAAVLAAAVAATGITYVGFHFDSSGDARRDRTLDRDASRHHQREAVSQETASAQARKTGKPVEVTSLRTARSTTWARPDGLMGKKLYASPVWAKVGQEWKPIDPTLHRTNKGWEPKATNTRMVFSAGSKGDASERASRKAVRRVSLNPAAAADAGTTSPLVTLTVDGTYDIQLTWPGPVPAPVIDGSRALYPEIFPGADLVLTADDDGFAQLIVVKNRQAATDPRVAQLSYGLSSSNLTFRLDPTSGIVAAENSDGEEVALSPTPLMWDSSGAPAVTDGELGATSQPTASETPGPTGTASASPTPSPSTSTEDLANDQIDPLGEVLPSATDGAEPTLTEPPLPSVPAEPTPAPSQSGSAATLSLPLLNGPSPESRGELVEADLSGSNWLLTPDQDFLNDPATIYPVFIDPTVKKHTQDWTTAYSRHPKATFFNGKDFNKGGTHEARVGFESDTWGTSRSYFNIAFDKSLQGAKIQQATLRLLETYSWSCSARSMSVHLTGPINGRTNWKNAPALTDSNMAAPAKSFAHGYKSGCRDDYETFNVTASAQKTADKGKDSITFGLRARDENSQYAWKKFHANGENGPTLELIFNRPPSAPTNLDLGPDLKCTTTTPYVRVGADAINFTAKAADKDKNLDRFDFNLWPAGKWETTGDLLKSTGTVSVGGDTEVALRTTPSFPTSGLTNGALYSWQVRAIDDAGATSAFSPNKIPCRFIFDSAAPKSPTVTSDDFPNADANDNTFGNEAEDANWSTKKFGTPGTFKVQLPESDVKRFEYGFNANSFPFFKEFSRVAGTYLSISDVKPPSAGPNVLYIRAVDLAGNVSEPTKYFFYVTPREQADTPGDFTGDKTPDLLSVTASGNLRLYPSHSDKDLLKGTGDLDYSMSGAYRGNPDKDPNGDGTEPAFIAPASGHFTGSLITHNGDFYGGDGLQDLIATVGGKLWVYPGDGYGAVNIDKRREILLPGNAPKPDTLTQIVATGDVTGDGLPDMFAKAGAQLWAFVGYTGAAFTEARLLAGASWDTRDIVTVADISGDSVPDLLFRGEELGRGVLLRHGKAGASGVDLNSLSVAVNSGTGRDEVYGTGGWGADAIPEIVGTPDANSDGIPDLWALLSDGKLYFYPGGRTTHGTRFLASQSGWMSSIAIG